MKLPSAVKELNKMFTDREHELYLVGGCVRDYLMNKEPHDYDMCTSALPTETIETLTANGISYTAKGIAFGTVVAIIEGKENEITTYREDMAYEDKRHPDGVSYVRDINSDLGRRDFTINAMAMNITTGEVVDPYDGKKDLENKVIRSVRDPYLRFDEDGLRILRAMRFAVKFGFSIEEETKKAMHENVMDFEYVSKERVTEEFRKTLTLNKPISSIFMEFNDIVSYLIPEIKECVGFNQNNKYHKHDVYEHLLAVTDLADTNKFEIKMAALLHDIGKPKSYALGEDGYGHFYGHPAVSKEMCVDLLKKDFRLTREETDLILNLVEFHDEYIAATKKSVKKFIAKHGKDFLDDWYVLKEADFNDHILGDNPPSNWYTDISIVKEFERQLEEEENCFSLKDLAVNGNDVKEVLGLKQGKEVGKALNKLFEMVLNEEVENTKDALIGVLING